MKFTQDGHLYTYKPTKEFFEWVEDQKRNNKETNDKISNESDAYKGLDFVMTKKAIETVTQIGNMSAQSVHGNYISTPEVMALRTSSTIYDRI